MPAGHTASDPGAGSATGGLAMPHDRGEHGKPGVPLIGAVLKRSDAELIASLGSGTSCSDTCHASLGGCWPGLGCEWETRSSPQFREENTFSPFCWCCLAGQKGPRPLPKPRLLQPTCLHLHRLWPSGHSPLSRLPLAQRSHLTSKRQMPRHFSIWNLLKFSHLGSHLRDFETYISLTITTVN